MKINIELDIPDGPLAQHMVTDLNSLDRSNKPNLERAPFHLRLLLLDALSEFGVHRTSAEKYVSKRYPDSTPDWREYKVKQVRIRNGIAWNLHAALTIEGITITELPS